MCMCVSKCRYLHIGMGLWWPGGGLGSLELEIQIVFLSCLIGAVAPRLGLFRRAVSALATEASLQPQVRGVPLVFNRISCRMVCVHSVCAHHFL